MIDIINLWQEAFGDSEDEIMYFLENCRGYDSIGYYEGEKLCSMMFLVDCRLDGTPYKYVYAAATFEEYKKRGFMSRLIDYAADKYGRLCLIPSNDDLITFYMNRGIDKLKDISELEFKQLAGIEEFLLDGFSLSIPLLLSN